MARSQTIRSRRLAFASVGVGVGVVGILALLLALSPRVIPGPLAALAHAGERSSPQASSSDPEPTAPEPTIRVRTARGVDAITLQAGALLLATPEGGDMTVVNSPAKVACAGGAITITDEKRSHTFPKGVGVAIRPADAGAFRLNGAETRTPVMLRPAARSARQIDVIALVPMETYVAGVVVSEIFPDWEPAAFAAQAIAARSYAMWRMAVAQREERVWDVENTQADQVYRGVTTHPVALAQTAATRGLVLVDFRGVLPAFYSSTCGGRSASALDTWPDRRFDLLGRPSLKASLREFACESSSRFTWSLERSHEEIRIRLRALASEDPAFAEFERMRGLSVVERNDANRPVRYAILDQKDRRLLIGAERLREALNTPIEGLPDRDFRQRILSGDLEMEPGPAGVTIRGRGFGHGVGMCQFCAQGMAKQGEEARAMLERFYPGATLERKYR